MHNSCQKSSGSKKTNLVDPFPGDGEACGADSVLAVGVAVRVGVALHVVVGVAVHGWARPWFWAWLRVWAWPWLWAWPVRGCKAQFSASPRSFPGLPIEFFSLPKSRFISLETSRYP